MIDCGQRQGHDAKKYKFQPTKHPNKPTNKQTLFTEWRIDLMLVNFLSFFALSDDFIFSHVTVDYKMHAVLGPVIKVERKLKNEQIVVTKIKIKL